MANLKSIIREIPDWPKKGINFKDITPLLQNKKAFKEAINLIVKPFKGKKIDKIVGIDARGFLIAAPVAYKLNSGLAIVRKPGKLPHKTIEQAYTLEYGKNAIQMHEDAVQKGDRVLLVDDLIATGGTAEAACDLVEKLNGKIVGVSASIDLPFLNGSQKLRSRGYKVRSLISYDSE